MNPIQDMNNNQADPNVNTSFIDRISSKDIRNLTLDIIPSTIYIGCIFCVLSQTPFFCDDGYPLIFRAFFIVYSVYILKGFLYSLLIYLNKMNILASVISLNTIEFFLILSYYTIVIIAYMIYKNSPDTCFGMNTFPLFVLFSLVLIGAIHIGGQILKLTTIMICFPITVYLFMSDPHSFYSQYGIDPEIVSNLPTIKAEKHHCISCVICTEDIKLGDEIMILRCPGRHHFHGNCIKSWLNFKVVCPMCRSENIL